MEGVQLDDVHGSKHAPTSTQQRLTAAAVLIGASEGAPTDSSTHTNTDPDADTSTSTSTDTNTANKTNTNSGANAGATVGTTPPSSAGASTRVSTSASTKAVTPFVFGASTTNAFVAKAPAPAQAPAQAHTFGAAGGTKAFHSPFVFAANTRPTPSVTSRTAPTASLTSLPTGDVTTKQFAFKPFGVAASKPHIIPSRPLSKMCAQMVSKRRCWGSQPKRASIQKTPIYTPFHL